MKKNIQNNYTAHFRWTLKYPIFSIPFMLLSIIIYRVADSYVLSTLLCSVFLIPFYVVFVFAVIRRLNFKFVLKDEFISVNQGFVFKKQKKIFYNEIQNIFVKQDFLDRLLGVYTLIIEDSSKGANIVAGPAKYIGDYFKPEHKKQFEMLSVVSNRIILTGLNKADVSMLKEIILKKIKNNSL